MVFSCFECLVQSKGHEIAGEVTDLWPSVSSQKSEFLSDQSLSFIGLQQMMSKRLRLFAKDSLDKIHHTRTLVGCMIIKMPQEWRKRESNADW